MNTNPQPAGVRDESHDTYTGWRDDPINAVHEDRLNRAPFAQHAARLIDGNHRAESSVVYGLEGPWGSGKSSVIAMITSFLTGSDVHNAWQVVPFTPWATTGTEGLLAEFFAALSTVAPKAQASRGLRERITAYADIARPIAALVPVVGAGVAEASRTFEERLRKPWNVAFAEVADELRSIGTPILVVVDDIDRLQPPELQDLLKVVRLLGRFPGVDFLLAYDERTLVDTLQDPTRGRISASRARAFMEKIVQYPLSMPPLLTGKIVKMLDTGLTAIVTPERIEAGFETSRFGRIILSTMPSQLATPRAIDRYLAQVRQQFLIHDRDEINDVDLILATFLRVQFPDLFAHLQRWKAELTRRAAGWSGLGRRDDTEPAWDELLGLVEDEQDRRDAHAVLQTLFPAVAGNGAARAGEGRFAHPDYFDRYLAQTIPEGDIPDAVITRALAQVGAGDPSALRALITSRDDEQSMLALSKIRARYADIGEQRDRGGASQGPVTLDLLYAGMALIDELEERTFSWTSTLSQTTHWMANVLRLALAADPRANVDPALNACTKMQRRAHVLSTATRDFVNVQPETQEALLSAFRREAERILPLLLDDLRERDNSDAEPGNSFLFEFVDKAGLLPDLQQQIREGLDAADFTIEDIAARFVSFAYTVGGPAKPSSVAFSGALFTKVTGVEADSTDFDERGEWSDTNWSRRREYAARFVKAGLRSDLILPPGE